MKKIKIIVSLLTVMLSGIVYAQPGATVATGGGQPGAVVPIAIGYLGTGSGVVGVQWDVNFDSTNLTADLTNCGATLGGTAINCNNTSAGVIRFSGFSGSLTEIPTGALGTIDFTIGAGVAPPVTFPLTVSGEVYSNAALASVPAVGTTDGAVNASAGPQDYSSAPAPAPLNFAGGVLAGGTDPTLTIAIDNVAAAASTLSYNCAMDGGADAEITVTSGGGAQTLDHDAGTADVVVSCDAATDGTFTGDLVCTHNGIGTTETSPATYPLSCTIDAATPTYTSVPAAASTIDLNGGAVALSGAGDLTTNLEISNTGDPATTLNTGNCSVAGGAAASFSIGAPLNAATAILTGNSSTAAITCTDPGTGNGDGTLLTTTLSCDNDDGSGAVDYTLQCTFTDAGDAVFASTPAAGSTTDLTGGTPVVTGTMVAAQDLVISNTTAGGGQNLEILSCAEAGDAQITVTGGLANNTIIAPGASAAAVSFGCDTAAVGSYSKTYTCSYAIDGAQTPVVPNAVFTHSCETRAAGSAGSPVDGTVATLGITAPPGGSFTNNFTFAETNAEGVDVTNLACALDAAGTTAGFSIATAPSATIASGTSSDLVVQFADGGTPPLTGVVTCTYDDSVMAGNTVTINLAGSVQAIVVPTMSWMGYVAMMFGLLLVGFFGIRRRA
jgi:hypothetical protein